MVVQMLLKAIPFPKRQRIGQTRASYEKTEPWLPGKVADSHVGSPVTPSQDDEPFRDFHEEADHSLQVFLEPLPDSTPREQSASYSLQRHSSESHPAKKTAQEWSRQSRTLGPRVGLARSQSHKRASQGYTLRPALSEIASLDTHLEGMAKSCVPKNAELGETAEETQHLTELSEEGLNKLQVKQQRLVKQQYTEELERIEEGKKPFRKRHRRIPAATRVRTSNITQPLDKNDLPPFSAEDVAIVSPEPVSAARDLRVRRSIPRLMESVSLLPAEAQGEVNSAPVELSLESDTCDTANNISTSKHDDENFLAKDDGTQEKKAKDDGTQEQKAKGDGTQEQKHSGTSKFKLRVKPQSPGSMFGSDDGTLTTQDSGKAPLGEGRSSPAQRKLRIKVSRNHINETHASHDGTVIRTPTLKQCHSLAEFEYLARNNMLGNPLHLEGDLTKQEAGLMTTGTRPPTMDGPFEAPRPSPQPPHQSDPQSPQVVNNTKPDIQADADTRKRVLLGHPRSLSGVVNKGYNRRRLRRKLSLLRIPSDRAHKLSQLDGTSTEPVTGKTGGRVRRWARGAKRVMRYCVIRARDRPTSPRG